MEVESPFDIDQDENEDNELDDEDTGNREDEAQEVPALGDEDRKVVKPKRVVKNPLPKLDFQRLVGPRGIPILQSFMKDIKFKGKGYEREDLNLLMKRLEHWTHRLFPKLPFDDTVKQIEKLGTKKQVQNMMKRIRLDMFQSDELTDSSNNPNSKEGKNVAPEVDVFDELLGTDPRAAETRDIHDASLLSFTQTPEVTTLTETQRERMERSRLLALERRKARAEQNEKSQIVSSEASMENKNSVTFNSPSRLQQECCSAPSTFTLCSQSTEAESTNDKNSVVNDTLNPSSLDSEDTKKDPVSVKSALEASQPPASNRVSGEPKATSQDSFGKDQFGCLVREKKLQNKEALKANETTNGVFTEDDVLDLINEEEL